MRFEIGKTYKFDREKYIECRGIENYQEGKKWINLIKDVEFTVGEDCSIYNVKACRSIVSVVPEWCIEIKKDETCRSEKGSNVGRALRLLIDKMYELDLNKNGGIRDDNN
ncbi:hypothetical protein C4T51_08975 [Clostridioides difficile]|uniref:hypothetical protein n=1 Tax=Clostridioides difficile TaxID=1496 RepID=UPI001C1BDD89|nr:hypothetical protein [Clostridioides difficile]MDB2713640.1 hypothetical protein [Clostridioides difficile]MDI3039422.1 hypothetical protein [Clostridioides difficile]HBF4976966.1 hypothetical protein [Clostridioides difficile]HBF5094666.1 hypothetical protein [Clostridioides difficile]HBG3858487.1 hypothetical protein [Clostridioides difficile]